MRWFEVVTACNGKHAIAELDVNSARFLAVRTDINLGGGTGRLGDQPTRPRACSGLWRLFT